jgi:alginate lyase
MNPVSRSFGGLCLLASLWACASNCSGPNSSPGASGPDSGVAGGMDATNGGVDDTGAPREMNVPDAAGEDGGVGAVDGGGVSSPIDLSMWYLELPTGTGTSPTTIPASQLAAGFSDAYFYLGADGGQVFMDPATGITTPGSVHCRSELHETDSSGKGAEWTSSGTNTMTVSGTVLKVGGGSSGDVTIAQVFNDTDSITLCELQYNVGRGGLELFYEESKGNGGETDLKTPIALGSPYTFTLDFSSGVLTVTVNGKQVYSHTPSSAVSGNNFFFKVGNYDQTASAGPISTTPYTIVEDYSVDVVHE